MLKTAFFHETLRRNGPIIHLKGSAHMNNELETILEHINEVMRQTVEENKKEWPEMAKGYTPDKARADESAASVRARHAMPKNFLK